MENRFLFFSNSFRSCLFLFWISFLPFSNNPTPNFFNASKFDFNSGRFEITFDSFQIEFTHWLKNWPIRGLQIWKFSCVETITAFEFSSLIFFHCHVLFEHLNLNKFFGEHLKWWIGTMRCNEIIFIEMITVQPATESTNQNEIKCHNLTHKPLGYSLLRYNVLRNRNILRNDMSQ